MTILTPLETAQMLRVSERTVRRLPIVKTYVGGQLRYDADDVRGLRAQPKIRGVPGTDRDRRGAAGRAD